MQVRFLRGKAKFGAGDLDGAVKIWGDALRLDPEHEESKRHLKLARSMARAKSSANELFGQVRVETLILYEFGFNQNYYIFASILLKKIVLCSKFH